ncbi:protein-S-isoprenylcysteine O-methyltransferase Ste14 [Haloactinospora alba]|uniref:Protein-S-isoprenylcysteine O-methyltransferase Ste14 n=1 Tax=Haloactinospora alba TaxID=405555 RepID=A0A543NME5_9ACTN|nr:methyltransferase [Haloactinospora alba]TQN33001.1 protein-S-isoprenylcysteine O-methyltransferase Ste14 [Haloactinospora alba]
MIPALVAHGAMLQDAAVIRAVAVFAPLLALLAVAARRPPTPVDTAGAVVATAWSGLGVFLLNQAAPALEWWSLHADGAVVRGTPVDLWLGWALLWGALPALLLRDLPTVPVLAGLTWLDVATMPLAGPVVRLGEGWLVGELAGVVTCLGPAAALSALTRSGRNPALRSGTQALLAGALTLALPLYLLGAEPTGPSWRVAAGAQLVAGTVLPGLAAAREFAAAGRGTPLPYDPPRRLVTSGPYGYLRNPMQVSVAAAYAAYALLAADVRVLAGVATAAGYGALATWHENGRLHRRFGEDWRRYRAGVRPWLPRIRPYPGRDPATLYVAGSCGMCSELGRWLASRRPVALRLRPAEEHHRPLERLTYEGGHGLRVCGVAALARALEHLHLGWALFGWAIALPGLRHFLQLAADAAGAGPRRLPRPDRG